MCVGVRVCVCVGGVVGILYMDGGGKCSVAPPPFALCILASGLASTLTRS